MWDDAQSDKMDRLLHWQTSTKRHTDIPKPQNTPHIQVSTHRERHSVQQSVRTSMGHARTKNAQSRDCPAELHANCGKNHAAITSGDSCITYLKTSFLPKKQLRCWNQP